MSRQQSDSKVCSNRRLIILGIVITVVVIAILTGVIVYLTGKKSSPTETIYGTMWLDKLEYKPATYGNPNSTEYKQLKEDFCDKTVTTLADSGLGKDMKTCHVTRFSKGSVKVHFQVVLKSGETTKEQLKDHLLKEMKKGEGQFNQYLKDPSAARLTMESAPEHITTSPTATPVVPTSSSAWPTTTTTSPTTHVVSTTSPKGPVTPNTGAPSGTITMTSSSVNRSTKRNESTHTTDTPTTTTSTTTTTPVRPYCERHRPCQHGGTCVSKGVDDYVCVCPRCGCYGGEPFHNCAIDKDNICSEDKFARDHTLLPHPYNCKMFISCTRDHRFRSEHYVWKYMDGKHVFNPTQNASAWIWEVDCAWPPITPLLCVNVTCLNGGTCDHTQRGFVCHCPYGYTGTKCETRLIPCAELKCEHGTCQNTENGGSHCICHANYYGRLCNSSIRHCVDVTCLNGGTCRDTSHGFRCDCREGYTGRMCIRHCVDVTCLNGGTCRDTSHGFMCICKMGYTRRMCETKIDCSYNPCKSNYTQCVDTDEGYECRCKTCNCSKVGRRNDCKLVKLDATKMCMSSVSSSTDFSGYEHFYISHPYNCDWYIWCFNKGRQGAEMKCAPPTHFNPKYNRGTDRPCVNYKPCKETW